ncbi:MAG: PQQ-binding-like beta-propeller repeat protein [Kosmotogaceae bacterium]
MEVININKIELMVVLLIMVSVMGFSTEFNQKPSNGTLDQPVDITLSWEYKNATEGLTYDIYFGTSTVPPLAKMNHCTNKYNPGKLEHGTKYYWKIAVSDKDGILTESPTWWFITLKPEALKWKYETSDEIWSSPTIGVDGTVYVGSWGGFLYVLKGGSKGLADSPWPKFRNNIKNTGSLFENSSQHSQID